MTVHIHPGRVDGRFLGIVVQARSRTERDGYLASDRDARVPESVLRSLSDQQLVMDLARRTVLDHELRHFHDLLLAPFGELVVVGRCFATLNGFLAATALRGVGMPGAVLPVPLQEWLVMSLAERSEFLEAQQAWVRRPLVAPDLPHVNLDDRVAAVQADFAALAAHDPAAVAHVMTLRCRLALLYYGKVEELWAAPQRIDPPWSTACLWEVPGLLCQLAALRRTSGAEATNRFLDWTTTKGPAVYRVGLSLVRQAAEVLGADHSLGSLLELATWAQLGAFEDDLVSSTPCVRLLRLIRAGEDGLRWGAGGGFSDRLERWDEVVGEDSLVSLQLGGDRLDRSLVQFRGFGDVTVDRVLPALEAWQRAKAVMVEAFMRDPERYVDPFAYHEERSAFPAAAVAVAYDDATSGHSDMIDATPPEWDPPAPFDTVLSLSAIAELSDALFLPGHRTLQSDGRAVLRRALGLEPLRLIR